MPNGLLVLDQTGYCRPVKAVAQTVAIENAYMWTRDGKSFSCTKDILCHIERR